jgi:hypothetical protein
MRVIPKLKIKCNCCSNEVELEGARLEQHLGEPLSLSSVGLLYDKLRCRECERRDLRLSDDAGRLLIDSTSITRCQNCKSVIPLPRLAAMPNSRICFACAADTARPLPDPPHPQPPPNRQKCPSCNHPTIVRQSKMDGEFFLGCTDFPKCTWTMPMPN